MIEQNDCSCFEVKGVAVDEVVEMDTVVLEEEFFVRLNECKQLVKIRFCEMNCVEDALDARQTQFGFRATEELAEVVLDQRTVGVKRFREVGLFSESSECSFISEVFLQQQNQEQTCSNFDWIQ